jgi:Leucine-rich repeat (LRR) protein
MPLLIGLHTASQASPRFSTSSISRTLTSVVTKSTRSSVRCRSFPSHLPTQVTDVICALPDLSCLRHLRELRADGNQIASTDGLQTLDSLVKLSLQGNRIRAVDFAAHRWYVV